MDSTVRPALLVDELVPTDETIPERVAEAKDSKSSVQTLWRAPWLLGLIGALLLLVGLALSARRSRKDGDADGDDARDDDGLLPAPRSVRTKGAHVRS